jgi:signal transduction histidine kinase
VVVVVFGAVLALNIAVLIAAVAEPVGLNTMAYVVVLPYSLVRWGAGREIGIGLVIILVTLVLGLVVDFTGVVEAVLGSIFLLFPATLGASVRYWTSARTREKDQGRLREREQLARELHDSVAHHVSAIAIHAQAGRVVAASRPEAALEALGVIEQEASRTLAEMRTMVGALRRGEEPDRAPQRGVADIERFASRGADRPRVEVELSGDLAELRPHVDAAIYRLAQESITNAVRHARHATLIDVRVTGDDDRVRLTVRDDGDLSPYDASSSTGYGLIGMTERATLLGGTLEAGPSPDRGWTVTAVLPREGAPR